MCSVYFVGAFPRFSSSCLCVSVCLLFSWPLSCFVVLPSTVSTLPASVSSEFFTFSIRLFNPRIFLFTNYNSPLKFSIFFLFFLNIYITDIFKSMCISLNIWISCVDLLCVHCVSELLPIWPRIRECLLLFYIMMNVVCRKLLR